MSKSVADDGEELPPDPHVVSAALKALAGPGIVDSKEPIPSDLEFEMHARLTEIKSYYGRGCLQYHEKDGYSSLIGEFAAKELTHGF